jgi:DedD protein
MGLFSVFQRKNDGEAKPSARKSNSAADSADSVQLARVRARQRLIGATILVVVGIIGFPLLFETQPRPIPVDIPIEIPRKEGAAPLVMPPVRAARPAVPAEANPSTDMITETRAEAGREVPAAVHSGKSPSTSGDASPRPEPEAVAEAAAKPAASTSARVSEGSRAQAVLEGKPASSTAAASRFVVQVGAFADEAAARETRLKVERLGLRTYTQVTNTASGKRIRVRVGPLATREEADKSMARIKAAGLPAVVLAL